jgi:hypothetical protein
MNQHDQWASYRKKQAIVIQETGISPVLFSNRDRFIDFLSTGLESGGKQLNELTNEQFQVLERFVDGFWDGWSQRGWIVWTAEKMRRFGNYG